MYIWRHLKKIVVVLLKERKPSALCLRPGYIFKFLTHFVQTKRQRRLFYNNGTNVIMVKGGPFLFSACVA